MSSTLSYKPLDVSKKEIRLLKFVSKEEGRIACEFEHAYLDDNPQFTALSYVWGDAAITQSITVNGKTFAATINLVAALSSVHKAWSWSIIGCVPNTCRLWVDAICINQNDYVEKNAQVQLMASIYQDAELVLGWLGPDDPELVYGLDTLELLYNETRHLSEEDLSDLNWMKKHPSLCLRGPDTTEDMMGNRAWTSVSSIFNKPFFSRVWILQELVLAKRLAFFTTSRVIGFSALEHVLGIWEKVQSLVSSPSFRPPEGFDDEVWLFLSGDYLGWQAFHRIIYGGMVIRLAKSMENRIATQANGWVVSIFGRSLKATNPKDHIYGLLALSGIDVKPDYDPKTTVGEVYVDYIASWLRLCARHHKDPTSFESYLDLPKLFFLNDSGVGSYENKLNLPTWVPNFPEESQIDGKFPLEHANADSNVFAPGVRLPRVKGMALIVQGVHIDTIASMSEAYSDQAWDDGTMLAYLKTFSSRNELYKNKGMTTLQVIISAVKLETRKMDTTERDLFYAFHLLRFILLSDLFDIVSIPDGLLKLGIDWGSFNADFLAAVDANYSGPHHDWKEALFAPLFAPPLKAEFDPGIFAKVLDDCESLTTYGRRFFESNEGYFGLCPKNTLPGDHITVLSGCGSPVVLRKIGDDFIVVGTCYVVRLMNGEAAEVVSDRDLVIEEICLK